MLRQTAFAAALAAASSIAQAADASSAVSICR
jgi:hypothetical protein